MDKYEYKLKTEEMLELMEDGEYRKAAAAADLIDWKRVRNAGMLMNVSDIYEKTKEYQKSYDVMNLAYRRSEGSRKVIYKLCSLAIKTKNIDEAIDYYDEFIQIAPKDPNRHILRYQILRAQRAPIEQQIEALEEFKKAEYIEEWAYELAKLYREAGMMTECLEECDDLILWFSEGKYVYKAMELKMQYKPLSPSQQQKYDHRYEKLSSETEEIPDLASYLGEDEEKDSASEGAEALGDTRSIGLTEQPVMENDSTSDVIDTDAVTLEAAEEPDAEAENQEEAGVETAEVIEASEDESEVQPATVETSGDKRTLSKDTASIPIVSKNPVKPVKKKLGDTMRLDEALQQLLNPKPEVQAEPGEEVEPDMTDLEEDIAAIEDVEDLEIVNQLTEEKKAEEASKERVVPSGMKELIPEPETSEDVPEDAVTIEAGEAEPEEVLEVEEAEPEEEEVDATVSSEEVLEVEEEPHENMGELADDLRLGEDEYEDYDAYDWDDAEEFDEDDILDDYEESDDDLLDDYEESDDDLPDDYEDADDDLFGEEEGYDDLDAYGYEEDDEDDEVINPRDLFTAEDKISDDDLLGLNSYEEVPNFEDEFSVNPAHSEEPDDREIPDEDDGIDIMSATTPLSRKETAKLIATGKTSPLPLDEIADAMSDTGFIVHGRYDLETQSGIGTRAGLTDEQKKLFSYFVPVRGMSEQLVDVLEQDKNCTNRKGTSRTGNLLIIGNKGNGKTVLAVDVVKAIQKQRDIRQGKVAIVTGESLNKKRIGDIFRKLYGGALIIEKAGQMNEKTLAKLNKAMEQDTGELLVVLEEQRKPLDRLLSSNREFRRKFTSRLEVPIFINDELVTFGQTYAQENGYRIDEMGILALYSKIDSLQREDHAVTVAEVKEVMDDAIAHSQKASAKKLVKRVFGKNTDSSDRILLSEKDFNI